MIHIYVHFDAFKHVNKLQVEAKYDKKMQLGNYDTISNY